MKLDHGFEIFVLDSSEILENIYKSVNDTDDYVVEPAERLDKCSLQNAIDVYIDNKLFCLAHIGLRKHKDALQLCQSLNATLPLPQNVKEHYRLIESFKRLEIDEKMDDFSTKIILDVRRLPRTGKVSLTFFL